jgi:hypothetical protein
MNLRMMQRYGLLSALLLCLAPVLSAQRMQQFTGHVLDTSGAVVAGAEIVVTNQGTGVAAKTHTTSVGAYTLPYLTPGTYTITASQKGFRTSTKTDIQLNVDQTSTIDFQLMVGSETQVVTVTASNTQIELSKSDRGEIIENERVTEMPLDSRNPYGLFGLSPGTHDFTSSIYPRPFDDVTNNQYANGAPQVISLNLDGISNDSGGGGKIGGFGTNPGVIPSVDTIQEFKVVLGSADASYGRGSASSMDVQLKSGTNKFHGILDYYKRGSWLDNYAWSNKYSSAINNTAVTKNPHNRNQFSLEFDGPVVIPHYYNGKQRLFFTVGYEEMLDTQPSTGYSYASIPNPAWLKGDFSTAQFWDETTQSLQPLLIYDPLTPLTQVADPNDNNKIKTAHAQFANNVLTGSQRIDTVGANIVAYMAQLTPNNNPGPGYAPWSNNWKWLQTEDDTWRNGLVKVDYTLSDADKLSMHWSGQGRWNNSNRGAGWPTNLIFSAGLHQDQPKAETGGIEWTHTFTPNLLFDFHATLMTEANDGPYGQNTDNMLKDLGFASSFYSQVQNKNHFPYVVFSDSVGWAQEGYSILGASWHTHTLGLLPTLTWIHGAHTIRTGLDLQFQQGSDPNDGTNDYFDFTSNFTNHYYNYSEGPGMASGSAYASALLGYLNAGTVYYNTHFFQSTHYLAPWVQDDYKITNKLTLNLGFRWDVQTPPVLRGDKMNGIFNTQVINPITSQLSFTVMGGTEFAGVNGQPRAAYKLNWWDWQPRVGFAYAFKPTMSLRGFVAKNYLLDESVNGSTGFSTSTGYQNSPDGGLTPYTATTGQGLSNPYPAVVQPSGTSKGYLTNIGNSFSFMNPNYHIPSLWNYSLEFEMAVTKHDSFNVAYVGNLEPDGPVSDNINHPSAQFYQQCNGEAVGFASDPRLICDNNTLSNTVGYAPNPFKGLAAFNDGSGYYTQNTVSRADLTRPYFGWWNITENGISNTYRSWYNSLQVSAKHEMANNLTLHFTYTHATNITTGNFLDTTYRILARQVSTTNQVKHAISFSGVGYLPFGQGRLMFSHVNRWVNEAINGWEISPLLKYYSGFPWRPGGTWEWNTSDPMGVAHQTLAADGSHNYQRIRGVTPCVGWKDNDTGLVHPSPAATLAGCTNIPYVEAASYAVPRNIVDFGVTQPGAIQFDASLSKNLAIPQIQKLYITENTKLQLRVDMFNVLNHPNWDTGYNGSVSSSNWGTISKNSGPTNQQRLLQLSAKLSW